MSLNFALPNDKRLTEIVPAVPKAEITSPETHKTIEDMLKVAYGNQEETRKAILVGLAANQLGIMKRIILVDVGADGRGHVSHLRAFINPEIIWKSPEQSKWYEGCYSTSHVTGIVQRPRAVRIRAYTPDGRQVTEKHAGYIARVFQHEIDHLNGKVFVDHITDERDLHWVKPDEYLLYRNERQWSDWPHKFSRAKWEEIKNKPTV